MLLALETLAKITSYPIDTSTIIYDDDDLQRSEKSSSESTKSSSSTKGYKNRQLSVDTQKSVVNSDIASESLVKLLSKRLKTVNVTNKYFLDFMVQLLECFKKDRILLERRGAFMIR